MLAHANLRTDLKFSLALFPDNLDHAFMSLFHRTAAFLLILFLGVLAVTTFIAFSRKSGNTKMDMGKAHLLRQKAEKM